MVEKIIRNNLPSCEIGDRHVLDDDRIIYHSSLPLVGLVEYPDRIILLQEMEANTPDCSRGILAIDRQGNELWRCEPFAKHPFLRFKKIYLHDGRLIGENTAFDFEIDPFTGKFLATVKAREWP